MKNWRKLSFNYHQIPSLSVLQAWSVFEPPHDKTNNVVVHPVWSESSLSTWKKAWTLSYPLSAQGRLWSDWVVASLDSVDWVDWRCSGWPVFTGCTYHFVSVAVLKLRLYVMCWTIRPRQVIICTVKCLISVGQFFSNNPEHFSQLMRKRYLSHRRTAKAQESLCICAVWPEPSLFTHTVALIQCLTVCLSPIHKWATSRENLSSGFSTR